MKNTLLIIPLLIFSTTLLFPQSKVNINNLSDYGGKMFKENDDKPYTGLVFDLYRTTGNKSLEGRYKDGLRNGKWSWWNEDNKMDSSGTYKDGNQDRKWTYWYENGEKREKRTYKNGKKDGLETSWYEDRQKKSEITYKDGKKEGECIYYLETGNGKYKVKYTAGTYNVVVFTDNSGNAYTGMPITKDPKRDGKFLYQESYRQGDEYDFSKSPFGFGGLKDGEKDGLWTGWHENGQKGEGTYKDGKKNGTWMHWDLHGSKILDENFQNGILNGPMISWYTNGQKEMVILWENGKKQDLIYWYEDGESINIRALNPFPIMELLDGKRDLETLPKSK